MSKDLNRNQIIEDAKDFVRKLEDELKNTKPLVYTSRFGRTYEQAPGIYCDPQARAMASDMFATAVMGNIEGFPEDIKNKAFKWHDSMNDLNYSLMRMFDDLKGDRPLLPYNYNKAGELISEFTEFIRIIADGERKDKIKIMTDAWAQKLLCMNFWAMYTEQARDISDCRRNSETRCFDSDGNMIEGISEEDERAVKTICDIRRILIKTLVKLPVDSDVTNEVVKRLEILDILCHTVLEEKTEELEYLLKCREAAEEFAEEV